MVCTEGGDTVEAVKVPLRGMTGYNMRDVRNYIRVEEPTVSMCDGPTFKDAGAAGQCTCTGVCLCWNGRCWDGWARRRVCVPSRALHAPWDAWGERAAQRAQPRSLLNRALPRRVAAAVCPPPCAGCTEVVVVPYEETHNVVFAFEPDMPCSAASSAEAKEAMRGALVPTPEGIKATNAVAVTAACRNGQADNATLVLKGVTKAQARKRPPPPTPLYMVLKRREHGRGVARPPEPRPRPAAAWSVRVWVWVWPTPARHVGGLTLSLDRAGAGAGALLAALVRCCRRRRCRAASRRGRPRSRTATWCTRSPRQRPCPRRPVRLPPAICPLPSAIHRRPRQHQHRLALAQAAGGRRQACTPQRLWRARARGLAAARLVHPCASPLPLVTPLSPRCYPLAITGNVACAAPRRVAPRRLGRRRQRGGDGRRGDRHRDRAAHAHRGHLLAQAPPA